MNRDRPSRAPRQVFIYQRRSAQQWRAAAREGVPEDCEPIGNKVAWLAKLLLAAADADNLLTAWESDFIEDLTVRLKHYGPSLWLSPRQRAALRRIETRIHDWGLR
jgi:hypothetical protein